MYITMCIVHLFVDVLGKMPCWYFNRSELKKTPSFWTGVAATLEEKYRCEGAKLINDAGNALRLYPVMYINYRMCDSLP